MKFTRTRIWRGDLGILGLPPAASHESPTPSPRAAADEPAREGAAAIERGEPTLASHAAQLADIDITYVTHSASTRIMPIESLFPEHVAQSTQFPEPSLDLEKVLQDTYPVPASPLSRGIARLRGGLTHAARQIKLSAAVALVLMALAFILTADSNPQRDARGKVEVGSMSSASASATDGDRSETEMPAHRSPPSDHKPIGPAMERAAVDALITGDFATAERLYRELAGRVPSPSPFSEAVRILGKRNQQVDP